MRAKTLLMTAASWSTIAATAMLIMPGRALAIDECGTVNTAADPQVASCAGALNPYASGITYEENTIAAPDRGNIQVVLVGTAQVVTSSTGVSVTGATGFSSDVQVRTAASVIAGSLGVVAIADAGNATIGNSGSVTSSLFGLDSYSNGGVATVINNSTGTMTVSGVDQLTGIWAGGDSALIENAGTVTVTNTGDDYATGLTPFSFAAGQTGTAINSGTVTVTTGSGRAVGLGVEGGDSPLALTSLVNIGTLSVTAGTGSAFGFRIAGGSGASIIDAQEEGAGLASTTITGDGDLTAAAAYTDGDIDITFSGVPITLNATGGFARVSTSRPAVPRRSWSPRARSATRSSVPTCR